MTIAATDTPVRADGLDLIGEMKGSGYRTPPALVRRADGQTVQLTPILYAVLTEIRDDRTVEQVAAGASKALDRTVTPANVAELVDQQLRPMGLLKTADGGNPELRRSNPLLGLRLKFAITEERLTRRLTTPFARLFTPVLAVAVVAGFLAVAWWVLFHKGLASASHEAFQNPGLLMLLVVVMLTSAGFHEFGHAAAATRGGSVPGSMGAGIYLVWPAFYTDVTDSYRLGRWGRIRTDLGGLYFDAIVAVSIFGVWFVTRWDGWLLVIGAQLFGMLMQLAPLVRFDGYHILCDVTGVPDLFQRIKPVLLSFLPKYWRAPEVAQLKPWVRVVTTAWVLVVVPALAFALFSLVWSLPRIAGTAWTRAQQHWAVLTDAGGAGELLDVGGRTLALIATVFPVLAIGLLLGRLAYGAGKATWLRTRGEPAKRTLAGIVVLLIIGVLAFAWWPDPDRYRPIERWERGTLTDAVPVSAAAPTAMRVGFEGSASLAYPEGAKLPTRGAPQLAMVLVPRAGETAEDVAKDAEPVATGEAGGSPEPGGERPWIFPFDRPLEPEAGDNQAMAVNYTDGGTTYDVAFAMVWVEGGADALNKNEAYALSSCKKCTTVAVAFQVVYIVGQSNVIVPQNIAAAVNYNCLSCVSVALAQQLAVTLERLPTAEAMAAIQKIWAQAAALSDRIDELSFAEITSALDDFEVQILGVLQQDGALVLPAGPTSSTGAGQGASPSPSPSPSATRSASPSSDASDGAEGPTDGEQRPNPSPSPDRSSTAPTPSASPTARPTATATSAGSP